MPEFVRIMSKADLPAEGEAREVYCGDYQLCIARVGGDISVMNNICPHNGGPLGEGIIENGKIVCPWHAWAFDVRTGVAEHEPRARVPVYEHKIEDDDVLAKLD
jgi:nitrite reductase (NADH) small subunit